MDFVIDVILNSALNLFLFALPMAWLMERIAERRNEKKRRLDFMKFGGWRLHVVEKGNSIYQRQLSVAQTKILLAFCPGSLANASWPPCEDVDETTASQLILSCVSGAGKKTTDPLSRLSIPEEKDQFRTERKDFIVNIDCVS